MLLRIFKHLTTWSSRKVFSQSLLNFIEQATYKAEQGHSGQIRVIIETALPMELIWRKVSAHQRALELFSRFRIWDTEHNNGILIYILYADRKVEIITDRGIMKHAPSNFFIEICQKMSHAFQKNEFQKGIHWGLEQISTFLKEYFLTTLQGKDELSNQPKVL